MAANNNNVNPSLNVNNLSLRTILQKDPLNNTNFTDWFRNLRIVLIQEKRLYVLDGPIPDPPSVGDIEAYNDWVNHTEDSVQVSCQMMASMTPEIQMNFENHGAYDIISKLKVVFASQVRLERFEMVRTLHACHMKETQSVSSHVLKMKSYIDHLARLNCPISNELAIDLILNSLSEKFGAFVLYYKMSGWNKSFGELHSMLKTYEASISKGTLPMFMIDDSSPQNPFWLKETKDKRQVKGNEMHGFAKVDICFKCSKFGHDERTCPIFM